MQYRIADLCIEYDAKYPLLQQRSQKYAVQVDKMALPLSVTQADIDEYRSQAPHLDNGSLEYLLMGARFYEKLLYFKGMLLHASAVVVDGEAYNHLIDPDTLMPGTFYRSVSILTEDSGYADMLSTAAFLMPYEESRAFIESLDGVEALWVFEDENHQMTVEMTGGAMAVAKSCGATNAKP